MKNTFPVYNIGSLSDFKQDNILISRFAPYLKVHKNLYLPHRHDFYHMVLFTEGAGSHSIDFTNFTVKPYQVYFMVPGQVHGWDFKGEVDGYVVNFSPAFFQSFFLDPGYMEQFPFFSGTAGHSVINLPEDLHGEARRLFEKVIHESEEGRSLGIDMVKALLLQFFISVSRLKPLPTPVTSSYNYTLFKNFQQLVEKNFAAIKLPRDYAALLYITPNHLNALCNDVAGISAGEVIRNRVTLEAKRLLVNFNLTISEVALRLDFADNSYFSKFFKKHEGITPEEFRKHFNTQSNENFKHR